MRSRLDGDDDRRVVDSEGPSRMSKRPEGMGNGDRKRRLRARMGDEMVTERLSKTVTAMELTWVNEVTKKK